MQYVEAFNSLGYQVPNPRQDWTAEKDDGICLTLWKVEVDWTPPAPRIDLWSRWAPGTTDWEHLPGHAKRTRHLKRAVQDFDGWVDAIIVSGTPGEGYGIADPWIAAQRKNHKWKVLRFDETSGFFAACAQQIGAVN